MKKVLAALVAGAFVMVQAPAVFAQDQAIAPKEVAKKAEAKTTATKAAVKADATAVEEKAEAKAVEKKAVESKKKKGGC